MSDEEHEYPPITQLTKTQRRVLGALVEKAFTTPEYYPMTLKAATNACNQKSNRSPVTNYSEDAIEDVMHELRELGLAAVVHTGGGRTERYRHYMRKRFTFTEKQLAIITELLLRGRQQLGELRSRANRMVPIEGQSDLKEELKGLIAGGYVQSDGPIERRGVEVDHNLYLPSENKKMSAGNAPRATPTPSPTTAPTPVSRPATPAPQPASAPVPSGSPELAVKVEHLESQMTRLAAENERVQGQLDEVKEQFLQLQERFDDLRQELGG